MKWSDRQIKKKIKIVLIGSRAHYIYIWGLVSVAGRAQSVFIGMLKYSSHMKHHQMPCIHLETVKTFDFLQYVTDLGWVGHLISGLIAEN